jgi:hypothetical protein
MEKSHIFMGKLPFKIDKQFVKRSLEVSGNYLPHQLFKQVIPIPQKSLTTSISQIKFVYHFKYRCRYFT